MKTSLSLIVFIFAVSSVSFSSCKNKESELKVYSEKDALKTDIPVNEENKFYASSTRKNFPPENVFDYDDKTFWSPEKNVIDEWLAVYVGKLENLGKFSECDIVIWDGYINYDDESKEFIKPTKYKIELYADENLILKQVISKTKYNSDSGYPGYIESNFDFQNLKYENGIIWVKVTILEAEKTESAAIRDIKLSFKNANPYNAYNEISLFCNAINQSEKNVLSNFTDNPTEEVLDQFTSEFVPEDGPGCRMESFEVHSEEIVSLHAVEGGDGGSRAFFKYDKGKWKLYKYAYFSYF